MLDEDVEGMQTTIIILQQELKAAKDTIAELEKENQQLKQPPTITPIGDVVVDHQSEQKIVFNGKDVKIEKIDIDVDCEQTLLTINTENNGTLINLTSSTATITTTTTTTNSNPIIESNNKNSVNSCNGGDEADDEEASSVAINKRKHDNSTLDGVNNQIIVINHKKLRRSSPILQKTITSDDTTTIGVSDLENLAISNNNKTVSTNGK
jgi:hypothetical protein